jgi:hypothetical protein
MLKDLLVSYGEKATDRLLDDLLPRSKYTVCRKVRLADVFNPDEEHWLPDERNYMFRGGHFDFVVTEGEKMKPLFAVEFDGEYHADPKQINRDILKDKICQKANFPICRLTNDDIKFKHGVQPALYKLSKIPEINSTAFNAFISQLDKQQLQILVDYMEWQTGKSPLKTFILPSYPELSERLRLKRNPIFILNSLKYTTYLENSKRLCKERDMPLSPENIANTTIEEIGNLNDSDLQGFVVAILLEELLKRRPENMDVEEYIRKTFPRDPNHSINVWKKFLAS